MILIIGSKGSMGQRYQAILKYLGKKFEGIDLDTPPGIALNLTGKASSYIVATPTDTHVGIIRTLMPHGKPILCEKPVCTDVVELEKLFKDLKHARTPFRMMFQYALLSEANRVGKSHYNYFRHGNDGLVWDCLQIIALSRGPLELNEMSPIWTCVLNGKRIQIQDMDAAYIGYVQKWLVEPAQDLDRILAAHQKTSEIQKTGFYGRN